MWLSKWRLKASLHPSSVGFSVFQRHRGFGIVLCSMLVLRLRDKPSLGGGQGMGETSIEGGLGDNSPEPISIRIHISQSNIEDGNPAILVKQGVCGLCSGGVHRPLMMNALNGNVLPSDRFLVRVGAVGLTYIMVSSENSAARLTRHWPCSGEAALTDRRITDHSLRKTYSVDPAGFVAKLSATTWLTQHFWM